MLAATVKIGGKNFVQVEVLQTIKQSLDHLPAKQKTMLEFKDAAAFLYPHIKSAVQKNYTKDEIQQVIVKGGWAITENSFRYLWSIYLSENGNTNKRRPYVRSALKTKADKNNDAVEENKNQIADKGNSKMNGETLSFEDLISTKDNDTSNKTFINSSAHFEMPPDTEDL